MKIFALETNHQAIKEQFLQPSSKEITTIFYHWFYFALKASTWMGLVLIMLLIGAVALSAGIPTLWVIGVLLAIILFLVLPPILKAFLEWQYDFVLVTTDNIVIVEQSALIRQKITPMNLDNFVSVSAASQFWGLVPFGILRMNLREGPQHEVSRKYIPRATEEAAKVTEAVTSYHRRNDTRRLEPKLAEIAEHTA
jgi:hypothetical protein